MSHSLLRDAILLAAMLPLGYGVARSAVTSTRLPAVTLVLLPVVGLALLVLELALIGLAGLPWSPVVLLVWAVLAAARGRAFVRALRSDAEQAAAAVRAVFAGGPLAVLLAVAVVAFCVASLLVQVAAPLAGWDAVAFWMFKARVFFAQHSFSIAPFAGDVRRHPDYPPLFVGIVDVAYVLAGGVLDSIGKAVNGLLLPVLAATVAVTLRPLLGVRWALAIALLAITCPLLIPALACSCILGYADFAVAVLVAAAVAHVAALARGERAAAGAIVAAAMAALVKNEGLVLFAVVVAVVLALPPGRDQLRRERAWVLPGLAGACVVASELYVRAAGVRSEYVGGGPHSLGEAWSRLGTIVSFMARLLASGPDYLFLVAAASLAVLLALLSSRRARLPALVLGGQVAGYVLAYEMTSEPLVWQLGTSADRLVLQVIPAVILLLGLGLEPSE